MLAPRPTPKLEDHPSSAVRDCLFNLFADTLLIGGRSSIRILPQYSYRFQYHTLVMSFIGTTKAFGLLLHLITFSETHTRYDSSGRRISPSQIPLPANTQHPQKTDIHASLGVRTRNPIKRVSADLRIRPRSHWDSLNPALHYSLHKKPPLTHIPGHMNPIPEHTLHVSDSHSDDAEH